MERETRVTGLRPAGTVGARETQNVENSMGDAIGLCRPAGGQRVSGPRAVGGFGGE